MPDFRLPRDVFLSFEFKRNNYSSTFIAQKITKILKLLFEGFLIFKHESHQCFWHLSFLFVQILFYYFFSLNNRNLNFQIQQITLLIFRFINKKFISIWQFVYKSNYGNGTWKQMKKKFLIFLKKAMIEFLWIIIRAKLSKLTLKKRIKPFRFISTIYGNWEKLKFIKQQNPFLIQNQ